MATAFDRFDANLDGALGLNCFWHLNHLTRGVLSTEEFSCVGRWACFWVLSLRLSSGTTRF